VNFTTQVLQSIGLGMGQPTEGLMERPPRKSDEQVMPLPLAIRLAIYGAIQAAETLVLIQLISINTGDEVLARTMGLVTFSFANLFYGLSCNDEKAAVFSHALLANGTLLRMSGISLVFIIIGVQLDFLNRLLNTTPLSVEQWVACAAAGSLILWVMEIVKFFGRRRPSGEPLVADEAGVAAAQA
jgi:Ca2+-transporting ATPase